MVTLAEAIETAAGESRRGFRFLDEAGSEVFLSFRDLVAAADAVAGGLAAQGLGAGERVALVLARPRDFITAFLGAIRLGAVPVPLYPPSELRRPAKRPDATWSVLERAAPAAIVADAEVAARLAAALPRTSARVLTLDMLPAPSRGFAPARPAADEPCFVQFTSGSTTRPRGVIVTHSNLAANVRAFMHEGLRVTPDDSGVTWLPLFHDMGLIGFVLGPLFTRNTVTFLTPQTFLKRPVRWLETISRYRATVSFGPSFAYALVARRVAELDMSHLDLSCWRVAGCGAEAIHAATLATFAERVARAGFRRRSLVACYGLAEATLAVTFADLGIGIETEVVDSVALARDGLATLATAAGDEGVEITCCGRPFNGHEVVVCEAQGDGDRPLPERRVGEILVRGPSVTLGHLGPDEASARQGEWQRTGDLGYFAEGRLFVCGRLKELLIVNGRNYFPHDLEHHATGVPGVRRGRAVAFAVFSPDTGSERVILVVEARRGNAPARDALARAIARAVAQATALTVDEVIVLGAGSLPKTSSGKLRRTEVKALYCAGRIAELEPGRGQPSAAPTGTSG